MYAMIAEIMRLNKLDRFHYVEPYAGGCGLALALLYKGHVSDIHINDLDPSIHAFWWSVLNRTDELVDLVTSTEVTMDNWHKFRDIQKQEDASDPVGLGFATFFLNRTNRSGILRGAGAIGGLEQKGTYKLDCRFNKANLANRIRRVARYKDQIHLSNLDACEFMKQDNGIPEGAFYCIDPPYFSKGSTLYTSFYDPEDHAEVARTVMSLNNPWIVTYDNAEEIRRLYFAMRKFTFDINYSLQDKRVGTEVMVASKGLKMPKEIKARKINVSGRLAA